MPSSMTRPSTWWNIGLCVASYSSVRKTRPGRDDVDRRRAGQHRARLHRAGLGAQHEVVLGRLGPEGVLHGAGRVVGAEVEGVEVQPLGLDERPLGDLPAHRDEDVGDPLGQHRDRVPGALGACGPTGRVTSTVSSTSIRASASTSSSAWRCGERLVDRAARLADALAGVLAGLRRQRADLAVGQRERRAVAGVLGADLLEGRRGRSPRRSRPAPPRASRVDVLLVERGHLDRVVLGVGARHVLPFAAAHGGVRGPV